MSHAFAGWAVEALVASTLLMLAVLLLRRPVRRAFGPDVAYALWALPALRLVLPPLPATWHEAAVAPVLRATEHVTVLLVEPLAAPTVATAPVAAGAPSLWAVLLAELVPVLALLWVAGAVAFVVWHTLAHHRFCTRMLAEASASNTIGSIHVIETGAASGPLAFGIWRRYVALPSDVAERYDSDERALALAHELGHHARGDLIANWVALAVLAVHWFNPLAWRAFRAFRADQEIANDARVLAGLSPMRRHAYACAIVKTAHPALFLGAFGAPVSTACHLNTIDDLKGRLRMLTTTRVSRPRLLTGAATAVLLIAGGLGLTASGTAAIAAARSTVEQATRIETTVTQAAPAPPAPPVVAPPSSRVAVAAPASAHVAVMEAGPPPPASAPMIVTDAADSETGDSAHRKVVRIVRIPATPAEAAAAKAGTSITKHRMVITMPGDATRQIEVQDVPEITESRCGIGAGKPNVTVIEGKSGEKRKLIICTDRIEKIASDAAAVAMSGKDMERNAYLHALAGLRGARARMMDSTAMTGDQRKAALDGIDTAIRELEGDLAKAK